MKYETLLVEIKYGVGIIWMNRPEFHNAFDGVMIAELDDAIRALDKDPAVRAVVLAGTGVSFCAGADMSWMKRSTGSNHERCHADALNFAALLHAIDTLKKPTIARVHGTAVSGGVGLVAACDMAVAAYDAEFSLSEVRIGLLPSITGPYVIRAMGERMARQYVLSGERFTAAEAYRTGLVTDITPLDELDARINELLGHLVQGGPRAQALSKEWIRAVACASLNPDLINDGALRMANASTSEEGREGILAFIEDRKPAWVLRAEKALEKAAAKKKSSPATRRKK